MPEDRLLLVSSDGHIGPPAEHYREYFDPKFRDDFDEWFAAYIPMWLTKGTTARESVKGARRHHVGRGVPGGLRGAGRQDPLGHRGEVGSPSAGSRRSTSTGSPPMSCSPTTSRRTRRRSSAWRVTTARSGTGGRPRSAAKARAPTTDGCRVLLGRPRAPARRRVSSVPWPMWTTPSRPSAWRKEHGINGGPAAAGELLQHRGAVLARERYDPLWSVCSELDMPLHTHVGPGSPYYSKDPFDGGLLWAIEASFWVHRPLWFFILSGVLEKHPTSSWCSPSRASTGCPAPSW